jgi:hypothetical protein
MCPCALGGAYIAPKLSFPQNPLEFIRLTCLAAFDLYGTLLSTESIAKELATHFGQEKGKSIAALWRRFASLRARSKALRLIRVDIS